MLLEVLAQAKHPFSKQIPFFEVTPKILLKLLVGGPQTLLANSGV